MAKMFPEWISHEQRNTNPKFRAEFKVYDALSRSLSDDWYVFYSRTWTWVEKVLQQVRMREADFIIAHPDFGILVMEVKGGRIEVKDGKWISTDRYGDQWDINPYEQVAIAISSLRKRLKEEAANPFRRFRFSTAVCFPDVDISPYISFLGPSHKRITIDATRMENFKQAIVEVMMDAEGRFDPPGEPRILMLKELVACSWYMNAPKSIQINDTETEIKRLTENQFKLLYQIAPTARRMLVTGCAGTGKTMLAAEIARRLVVLENKRVLFTCYNRNLALWLRTSSFFVDNGMMMVANYQKLCADFARNAGIELPKPVGQSHKENDPIFKELYPNLLLEVAAKTGEQFDAIVVDEGQDFLDTWWTSLFLLLRDDGCFHVYSDSHQQLWGPTRSLPPEITDGASTIDLNENIRNTRAIHDLAMNFHPSHGVGYKALIDFGIEPEYVPIPSNEKEHQVVRRVVEQLVTDEQVSTSDVAILTPLSLVDGNSYWKPGSTLLGQYRLVHHLGLAPHEIFCSSIGAAKGLEFPVVLLTELHSPAIEEEVSNFLASLYVGISRARSHVIIFSAHEEFERLCASYELKPSTGVL